MWPLTTHPFRDGAPFLLLVETPPTFGRSLRFCPYITKKKVWLSYPHSCFAVCGHHLSPKLAIVFSLLSSLPEGRWESYAVWSESLGPLTHGHVDLYIARTEQVGLYSPWYMLPETEHCTWYLVVLCQRKYALASAWLKPVLWPRAWLLTSGSGTIAEGTHDRNKYPNTPLFLPPSIGSD